MSASTATGSDPRATASLPQPERLRRALQRQYARLALFPQRPFHLHTGAALAAMLGYPTELLAMLPKQALDSFSGAAYPFALAQPERGQRVLDVGCGSGVDVLLAAGFSGPQGQVVGIDVTAEMVGTASDAARAAKLRNVELHEGEAEAVPLPDASVDLVVSNNVLNHLVLDKPRALSEMWRVLRPGGTLLLGDVILERPVPDSGRAELNLWTT
jgi:arsenite methyltransferase